MLLAEKEILLKTDLGAANNICYDRYQELGGIINKGDYDRALAKAAKTTFLRKTLIAQARIMAHASGIILNNSEGRLDAITLLYGILRTDTNPGVKYHHSQMSDQRLFAEALRMLNYPDLLRKFMTGAKWLFPYPLLEQ